MPDISILQELYVAELKNLKMNPFFKPNRDVTRVEKQTELLDAIVHGEKRVFREESSVPPHLGKEAKPIFRMKFENYLAGEKKQLRDESENLHLELREDDEGVVNSKVEYFFSKSKLNVLEKQLADLGVKVYLVTGNKVIFATGQGAILTEVEF